MQYVIDRTHYHRFDILALNKLPPRSYFIPFSSREKAAAATAEEKRYTSDKVRCLSSNMEKISYEDFDDLMCELEKTQQELYEAHFDFDRMKQMWDSMMSQHAAKSRQSENASFCNVAAKRKGGFL